MTNKDTTYTIEPTVTSIEELVLRLQEIARSGNWIFRGQHAKWELETSLERYCNYSCYSLTDAIGIEAEMIRNFQRLYTGEDKENVMSDTLYCISLMRHHEAPSRLLDFTYSQDVALYFGLEAAFEKVEKENGQPDYDAPRRLAIWCLNTDDMDKLLKNNYRNLYLKYILPRKSDDKMRGDITFKPLYMDNRGDFVNSENPLQLHPRLDIQHGVFLCPGNVAKPFMQNLSALYGNNGKHGIFKLICEIEPLALRTKLEEFRNKTITRQSLLPGLDGFAQSMKYKFLLFKQIADARKGPRKEYEDLLKTEKDRGKDENNGLLPGKHRKPTA